MRHHSLVFLTFSLVVLLSTGCGSNSVSEFNTDSIRHKDQDPSISFRNYRLGMTLDEFYNLPMPMAREDPPSRGNNWRPSNQPPRLFRDEFPSKHANRCFFHMADLAPFKNDDPQFLFFKSSDSSEPKLLQIWGGVEYNDVAALGDALTMRYGAPAVNQPLNSLGLIRMEWKLSGSRISLSGNSGRSTLAQLLYEDTGPRLAEYQALKLKSDMIEAKAEAEEQRRFNERIRIEQEQEEARKMYVEEDHAQRNEERERYLASVERKQKAMDVYREWKRSLQDIFRGAPDSSTLDKLRTLTNPPSITPEEAKSAKDAGLKYIDEGNYALAMQKFRDAADADPTDAEVWSAWCKAALKSGRCPAAIEPGFRCVALDPNRPVSWIDLAEAYTRNRREAHAVGALRIAVSLGASPEEVEKSLQEWGTEPAITDLVASIMNKMNADQVE